MRSGKVSHPVESIVFSFALDGKIFLTCGTRDIPDAIMSKVDIFVIFLPSKIISPLKYRIEFISDFVNVDFPEPFGPIIAVSSPVLNWTSIFLIIGMFP